LGAEGFAVEADEDWVVVGGGSGAAEEEKPGEEDGEMSGRESEGIEVDLGEAYQLMKTVRTSTRADESQTRGKHKWQM
jgi:hypothetical protein